VPQFCALCKREIEINLWRWSGTINSQVVWACSSEHLVAAVHLDARDDTMSEIQEQARILAGKSAGKYLNQIEKTDMADMTSEEWKEFLRILIDAYADALTDLASKQVPF
jgi:hypothetical protein